MKLYGTPIVQFGGGPLVMVGGGRVMVMLNACVAFGAVPLLAITVPGNVPRAVGVPLMTPAGLKVKPGGRDVEVNVGELVAV